MGSARTDGHSRFTSHADPVSSAALDPASARPSGQGARDGSSDPPRNPRRQGISGVQNLTPQTEEDIAEVKWVPLDELDIYMKNSFPSIIDVVEKLKEETRGFY